MSIAAQWQRPVACSIAWLSQLQSRVATTTAINAIERLQAMLEWPYARATKCARVALLW